MVLAVFPHNRCWPSRQSRSGYATHGGMVLQIGAISELFDATRVIMPSSSSGTHGGEMPIIGHNICVVPLRPLPRTALRRRLALPLWAVRNGARIVTEMAAADAVFVPVPGEIATLVLILALILRKPLLVRYIANWSEPRNCVDRLQRRLLERCAGGKNVVLVTGESEEPPSPRNLNMRWIFSTTLREEELAAGATPRLLRTSEHLRLIIVARQEIAKGTDLLLRSLSLVTEQFPGIRLDVVGDGSALQTFRELAKDLGVEERVRFHGHVDHAEVLALLRAADLYCLPTIGEAFAKSVIEALGCGLPVVTTRVSVFPRLIGTRCGVVVDQRTPEHLAAAIRHCLSDRDRYCRMSTEAIAIASRYSLERWRDIIGAILDEAWGPLARRAGSK